MKKVVLIVVPNWPDGTMSHTLGQVIKKSLDYDTDTIRLLQFAPERIFRIETEVTEEEFRLNLSKYTEIPNILIQYIPIETA